MALLSSSRRRARHDRTRRTLVAGALLAGLWVAGCAVLDLWREEEDPGPGFSHRIHVADQGLDCSSCHEPAEEGGPPSMPSLETCQLCHEGMDEELPPERRPEAFFVDGAPRPGLPALGDEVLFSHAGHVAAAGGDCATCHGDVEASERVLPEHAFSMDDCTSCHGRQGVDPSCATCHSVIDEGWEPASHDLAWDRVHGQAFRAGGTEVAARCTLCHTESSCTACHLDQPPASHDNHWRLRGHAIPASLDRESCATCHRDDSCQACHDEIRPLSHRGSFGGMRSNHCLTCHFPLRGEGCATCHESTPSHRRASPQPPDHTPGANCRLCHGALAQLPHADDGSECSLCHE